MTFLTVLFALSVTCSLATAYIAPQVDAKGLMPLQRQELNLYVSRTTTTTYIKELLDKLLKNANEAKEARAKFSKGAVGIGDVWSKIAEDVEKLRNHVSEAFENVKTRLLDSSVGITECIATCSDDANAVFNEAIAKTKTCIDDRAAEVTQYAESLSTLVNGAVEYYEQAIGEVKNCSEASSILTIGPCLGSIALQADVKVFAFSAEVGLMLARMEIFTATLPASLQICASTRLVEAGLQSAKIVMDIGACSASFIFNTIGSKVHIPKETS